MYYYIHVSSTCPRYCHHVEVSENKFLWDPLAGQKQIDMKTRWKARRIEVYTEQVSSLLEAKAFGTFGIKSTKKSKSNETIISREKVT